MDSPAASESSERTSTVVRFGVLGTGRITRRLVADLQSTPGVNVTAIASRTAERARWFADQYGIASAVVGYEALLRREDVDAVYISLPPSLHREWSVAAAACGKHLLCEKPLATTVDEAKEIDAAYSRAGLRWLDATGWLHHERTDAVMASIRSGRLGALRHVSASVSFFEPFQSVEHRRDPALGGGCLLDLGWYTCGLARFATGSLPRSVFADAIMRDGVPFRVTGMLWFDDDVSATISCGYDTATRKWFEVAGSAAAVVCDDFTRPWAEKPPRFWVHHASGKVDQESFGGHQEHTMIETLIGGGSLASYQRQAIETQVILDAMAESIRSRRRVEVMPETHR